MSCGVPQKRSIRCEGGARSARSCIQNCEKSFSSTTHSYLSSIEPWHEFRGNSYTTTAYLLAYYDRSRDNFAQPTVRARAMRSHDRPCGPSSLAIQMAASRAREQKPRPWRPFLRNMASKYTCA